MTALYEISENILELQSIESDGDISLEEALKNSLDELEMDFYDKANNIVKLINQISSDTLTVDNEIKRLQERKQSFKRHQDGLKHYLIIEMEKIDKKTIKTPLFSITSALGREKVIIDNEEDIPSEYIIIKMTESPDKKAILAMLKEMKDGEESLVPGCHIERGENSLKIK